MQESSLHQGHRNLQDRLARLVDELTHDPRSDLEAAAAIRNHVDHASSQRILIAACERAVGGTPKTRAEVVGLLATRPDYSRALRAIVVEDDASDFSIDITLLVSRMLLRSSRPAYDPLPNTPAPVQSLSEALVAEWSRLRRSQPHAWLYHPRKTELSAFVIGKLIDDLRAASPKFEGRVATGDIVGDVNVDLEGDDRRKALDLVVGPSSGTPTAPGLNDRIFRAPPSFPLLTLEVKACMTSHRQSTPRLLDELMASLDVVKAQGTATIPVAILIVNVSEEFTNPLHLPGPNRSKSMDIERLFRRILERIPLDSGSGREHAYGAIGVGVVDTDNERRLEVADASKYVPPTHTFGVAIARAAALFERVTR